MAACTTVCGRSPLPSGERARVRGGGDMGAFTPALSFVEGEGGFR